MREWYKLMKHYSNNDYDQINNLNNICPSCKKPGVRKREWGYLNASWGCINCGDLFLTKEGGYIGTTLWGQQQQKQREWKLEKRCETMRRNGDL